MAPSNINLTSPEPSARSTRLTSTTTAQLLTLPNAFGRIIEKEKGPPIVLRNTCLRPIPEYNTNYNPYIIPRKDLPSRYSPYVFKKPLFNN